MSSTVRTPRNTLSRELVVSSAVQLADRDGLGALTIRALAAECGVKPMAIYHHITNKEAILDAIVDAVYAEIYCPKSDKPWREELATRSRSMRAALGRHPWSLSMLEGRRNPGPEALDGHEACLQVLRSAAFSLQATAHAYAILDAFVYGFSLQEAMLHQVDLDDAAADLIGGIDLSGFPHMAEFASEHVLTEDYSFGSSFEIGLGLTLDSLERLRVTYN